jgi:hypothetical protein
VTITSRGNSEGRVNYAIAKWNCLDGRRSSITSFSGRAQGGGGYSNLNLFNGLLAVTTSEKRGRQYSLKETIFDLGSGRILGEWPIVNSESASVVAISNDQRYVALRVIVTTDARAEVQTSLQVYDAKQAGMIARFPASRREVSCCFTIDGQYLAIDDYVLQSDSQSGLASYPIIRSIEIRAAPFDDAAPRWRLSGESWRFDSAPKESGNTLSEHGMDKRYFGFRRDNRKLILIASGTSQSASSEGSLRNGEVGVLRFTTPIEIWK